MNPNECLSYWLIEELVAQGITQFCISPGSRSTPLTVAAARNHQANTQIFLDERAAAYFAMFTVQHGCSFSVLCSSLVV